MADSPAAPAVAPQSPAGDEALSLDDLAAAYRSYQEAMAQTLLERIMVMAPQQFERFATEALRALGFVDMTTTRYTGDNGVDATGTFSLGLGRVRAAAQFKRWRSNVGRREVDQFRGAIVGQYELGVFVTTSDFVAGVAAQEGRVVPILLLNGEELVRRLVASKTGVRTAETWDILELDEEWLAQFTSAPAAQEVPAAGAGLAVLESPAAPVGESPSPVGGGPTPRPAPPPPSRRGPATLRTNDPAAVQAATASTVERLRGLRLPVSRLGGARWQVGRAICFVHFSRPLSQRSGMQPGEAPIYWYGLRREVVRQAAARGPVYLVLILGNADHLLIVPYRDVKDMFDAAPVDGIGRCHVQVWGQPGRSRLRYYMPERQQRDADAWLNALAAIARDGAPLSR